MKILENAILPVILIALIIAIVLLMVNGRNKRREMHYDEMQLKIRGDGYKIGYFVTLAGLAVLFILMECVRGFNEAVAPSFGVFVVVMAGIISSVVYCIRKEAFFTIGQNAKSYMILCLVIVACNAVGAFRQFAAMAAGTFPESGQLTFSNSGNLVCGISFLVVLIALIAKNAQGRKEAAE